MKNNKNVSEKVKNGQIVHTRDEYFYGAKGYVKPSTENKGNYRMAVVVDTNRKDEMAIVKMTTKGGRLPKGSTASNVYTKNNENAAIKSSSEFIVGKKKISEKDANAIKKGCIDDEELGKRNRKILHKFKGR